VSARELQQEISGRSALPLPAPQRIRVRWKIFLFLFGFGFIAYVQQRSLTVASYRIMPDLDLSQMQIGWLEEAFLLTYAFMQFPGGVIGQRLGARLMFVLIGLVAVASCMVLPLAPLLLTGTALFGVLLGAQLLLGATPRSFRCLPESSRPGSRPTNGRWCRDCRAWVWASAPLSPPRSSPGS
jgi:MFS family permease